MPSISRDPASKVRHRPSHPASKTGCALWSRGGAQIAGVAALALGGLTGCPARVGAGGDEAGAAQVDESDPRVIRSDRTGDLYPRDVKAMPEDKPDYEAGETEATAEPSRSPGVGKPDESNGVCRLYAPEYPDPECCAAEYGVDAERIKAICGFEVYLGEHFRNGCGYHFKKTPTSKTQWLWAGLLPEDKDTATAKYEHDLVIQKRFKQVGFESEAIPGVPGGYRSVYAKTGWAVIPGWKRTRQFGYPEGFCDEGLDELLAELARAKQPPEGAQRPSLVPRAR